MRLPGKRVYDRETHMADIKGEKKLNGIAIRGILMEFARSHGLLCRTERNVKGINENPFDLAIGDPNTLDMCGIEIKGDSDDFSRLPKQVEHYLYAFNSVYIALHKKKAPDWLPYSVGIIRVSVSGTVAVEMNSEVRDPLAISTEYEWDQLFKANGLGTTHIDTRKILSMLNAVRRNILFNRFFALPSETKDKGFDLFYPLTNEQRSILMSYNINYHYGNMKRDIAELERRLKTLKEICRPYDLNQPELTMGGK